MQNKIYAVSILLILNWYRAINNLDVHNQQYSN